MNAEASLVEEAGDVRWRGETTTSPASRPAGEPFPCLVRNQDPAAGVSIQPGTPIHVDIVA